MGGCEHKTGAYPTAVPKATCHAYFKERGFALRGNYEIPMSPATTEVLVFQKA